MALRLTPFLEKRLVDEASAAQRDPADLLAELVRDGLNDRDGGDFSKGSSVDLSNDLAARVTVLARATELDEDVVVHELLSLALDLETDAQKEDPEGNHIRAGLRRIAARAQGN